MDTIEVAIGQDFTIEHRIRAGDGHGKPIKVTLTANALAGATSLSIKPDHPALASGDKLLLGEDAIVTLSGACAAGVSTLAVTATDSPFQQGDELVKIQDLTGYSIKLEVLTRRGDATPYIADTSFTVTLATQSGSDRGKCQSACLAAVTTALQAAAVALGQSAAGSYYAALWRRDSGSTRPLDEFTLKLVEAGFL
jgi:hypothetical protein